MNANKELVERLTNSGAAQRAPDNEWSKLRSGENSKYSIDVKTFDADTANLKLIVAALSGMIREDAVAGIEMGSVPIAVGVSLATDKMCYIVRKDRKAHGDTSLLMGGDVSGKNVAVIDDVVTKGGSVLYAVDVLRERKAIVEHAYCVVDREEGGSDAIGAAGVRLHSLVRKSELFGTDH
jgi:orotate phosphoribosyltransferase